MILVVHPDCACSNIENEMQVLENIKQFCRGKDYIVATEKFMTLEQRENISELLENTKGHIHGKSFEEIAIFAKNIKNAEKVELCGYFANLCVRGVAFELEKLGVKTVLLGGLTADYYDEFEEDMHLPNWEYREVELDRGI